MGDWGAIGRAVWLLVKRPKRRLVQLDWRAWRGVDGCDLFPSVDQRASWAGEIFRLPLDGTSVALLLWPSNWLSTAERLPFFERTADAEP
jgi:hypothetical protein